MKMNFEELCEYLAKSFTGDLDDYPSITEFERCKPDLTQKIFEIEGSDSDRYDDGNCKWMTITARWQNKPLGIEEKTKLYQNELIEAEQKIRKRIFGNG